MQKKQYDFKNFLEIVTYTQEKKQFKDGESVFISGIANHKNMRDLHGDIPVGKNVYDLSIFASNPVLLRDHTPLTFAVAGNFIMDMTRETEKGLEFQARLRPINKIHNQDTKDAVQSVIDGFLKGISIAGFFKRSDEDSDVIVKALIHEISLVALPADPHALIDNMEQGKSAKSNIKDLMRRLLSKYNETSDKKYIDSFIKLRSI